MTGIGPGLERIRIAFCVFLSLKLRGIWRISYGVNPRSDLQVMHNPMAKLSMSRAITFCFNNGYNLYELGYKTKLLSSARYDSQRLPAQSKFIALS